MCIFSFSGLSSGILLLLNKTRKMSVGNVHESTLWWIHNSVNTMQVYTTNSLLALDKAVQWNPYELCTLDECLRPKHCSVYASTISKWTGFPSPPCSTWIVQNWPHNPELIFFFQLIIVSNTAHSWLLKHFFANVQWRRGWKIQPHVLNRLSTHCLPEIN